MHRIAIWWQLTSPSGNGSQIYSTVWARISLELENSCKAEELLLLRMVSCLLVQLRLLQS